MEKTILSKNQAKQQVRILRGVWGIIEKVLDKEKDYLSKTYFNLNLAEEKAHIGFRPDNVTNFLTVKEGAIYFSVKWIIDTLVNGQRYAIQDVLTCRLTAIYGEGIAVKYEKQLREGLKNIALNVVLSFDYAELQKAEVLEYA